MFLSLFRLYSSVSRRANFFYPSIFFENGKNEDFIQITCTMAPFEVYYWLVYYKKVSTS